METNRRRGTPSVNVAFIELGTIGLYHFMKAQIQNDKCQDYCW